MSQRTAAVNRETLETQITVSVNLDGQGKATLGTGLPFLEHMLDQVARHGLIDIEVMARGDLHIDAHHTVEDIGICLGQAFAEALQERRGIRRYGHQLVPMDEALAWVVVDLSNRPYLVYNVPKLTERVGEFETELIREFFRAFAVQAGVTMHINVCYGDNSHHIIEAIFKAWAQAMRHACEMEPGIDSIPSTKGVL